MVGLRQGFLVGLMVLVGVVGCGPKRVPIPEDESKYWQPLPEGELALVKLTDPSEYPDFSEGYMRRKNLEVATLYSLEYLSKPSSRQFYPYLDISHERVVASLEEFLDVISTAQSGDEFDQMIRDRFEVYVSRGYQDTRQNPPVDTREVLFTGYYRPIFDARLQRDGTYRYPLHRRPDDLERNEAAGVYQRKGGGRYFTRGEIAHGALDGRGLELCWLKDRFETYIITVQGSARLRLADGSFMDIGYHGDNGYEYTSVGQYLVDQKLISYRDLSLQGLIRFFKEHPEQLDTALAVNERYVFFTPRPGGPFGSLNVPVTPFRSIATDKQVYPRAAISFIETILPARLPGGSLAPHSYRGFALDQDTGGAIRAAGRCDAFLGTGPEMGERAGRTFATGRIYYIFIKPELM